MEAYPEEARRGRAGAGGGAAARAAAPQPPHVQPVHRLHPRGAARARARGAAARRGQLDRAAGPPGLRQHRPQDRAARALHRPRGPPGPQRAPLLQGARGPPRGVPPRRLHAHRGPGLPAVQPDLPPRARPLDHPRAQGAHDRGAGQRPLRGRAAHRGDRQRAHPRPRRPGRGRDGHPGRQARPLRGRGGHPPRADAAGQPRRRHRQPGSPRRRPLHRLAAAAAAGRGLRRGRRRVRAGGEAALPEGPPAVGGLQAVERLPPARALPQGAALLQRRHPGHGRGGGGRASSPPPARRAGS